MSDEESSTQEAADTGSTTTDTTTHKPIFSSKARSVIYILCIIAAILGAILYICGAARGQTSLETAGEIVDTVAAILAAGFGVAYTPVKNLFS